MAVLIVGHALFIRGPVSQIDTDTIEAANQPVEQSIPESVTDVSEQPQQNQLQ
jgi:hypothetical protein